MKTHQTSIDRVPFRSKADHEREAALQAQYHRLALPAVVAALQKNGSSNDNSAEQKKAV